MDHYNAGLKMRGKALALQKEAAQAASKEDRTKLEKKAQQEFGRAISQFRTATERKTGDYASALETYDRAISLAPTYAPAIEYRADAIAARPRSCSRR